VPQQRRKIQNTLIWINVCDWHYYYSLLAHSSVQGFKKSGEA